MNSREFFYFRQTSRNVLLEVYLGKFFKKIVQTSEKKTCLQFSECSLSYSKMF